VAGSTSTLATWAIKLVTFGFFSGSYIGHGKNQSHCSVEQIAN
jgi:hypothetical protein